VREHPLDVKKKKFSQWPAGTNGEPTSEAMAFGEGKEVKIQNHQRKKNHKARSTPDEHHLNVRRSRTTESWRLEDTNRERERKGLIPSGGRDGEKQNGEASGFNRRCGEDRHKRLLILNRSWVITKGLTSPRAAGIKLPHMQARREGKHQQTLENRGKKSKNTNTTEYQRIGNFRGRIEVFQGLRLNFMSVRTATVRHGGYGIRGISEKIYPRGIKRPPNEGRMVTKGGYRGAKDYAVS